MCAHVLVFSMLMALKDPDTEIRCDGPRDELEARWRREYPAAAARLEDVSRQFVARGTRSTEFLKGDVYTVDRFMAASSQEKHLLIDEGRVMKRVDGTSEALGSEVRCETTSYAFVLRKSPSADSYRVTEYAEAFGDPNFAGDFNLAAFSATRWGGESLVGRMQSPSFELRSIESLNGDGQETIRINYTFKDQAGKEEAGEVDLLPQQGWVIDRIDQRVSSSRSPGSVTTVKRGMRYARTDAGSYFPRRVEVAVRPGRSDRVQRDIIEYQEIQFDKPRDDMFTLSAYGLPDIPLKPEAAPSFFSFGNPLLWGSLAVAAVCFILLRLPRLRDGSSAPTG